MYIDTLDIRDIAQEWRDLIDEADEANYPGDESDIYEKFELLCNQLGCDHNPDSLEYEAEMTALVLINERSFTEYAMECYSAKSSTPTGQAS